MDGISVEAGLDFAQKRAAKDTKNREVFNDYKGGFLNFGSDIDGLDLDATVIDYSGIKKNNKIKTVNPTPINNSPDSNYSPVNQLGTAPPTKNVEAPATVKSDAEAAYGPDPAIPYGPTGASTNPNLPDPETNFVDLNRG
jgi:hypothetical protein